MSQDYFSHRSPSISSIGLATLILAAAITLPAHGREAGGNERSARVERAEKESRSKPRARNSREARREDRSRRQDRSRDARQLRSRRSNDNGRASRHDRRSYRDTRGSDRRVESRNKRHRGDSYSSDRRYNYNRRYDDRRYDRRYEERRHRDRRYTHRDRRYEDRRSYRHRSYGDSHRYSNRHRSRPWYDCDYSGGIYVRYGGYNGRNFDVPRVVVTGGSHGYDDYYYDRVYHSDHGRWYEVYLFPVYHHDRVEYRPYVYCEGKLYGRARFDSYGGLSFELEFNF